MNENLLKSMVSVVDKIMQRYKTDFYRHDLAGLYMALTQISYKRLNFWWVVNPTHTHLLILNDNLWTKRLDESQGFRFYFGKSPEDAVAGIILRSAEDEGSVIYHYDASVYADGFVHEWRGGVAAKEFMLKHIQPTLDRLSAYLAENYPNEAKWYNRPVAIKFASASVRSDIMNILRTEEGKSLLERLHQLKNWCRVSDDHKIVIGGDWSFKTFSFGEYIKGKAGVFGGIVYDKEKHEWGIHT